MLELYESTYVPYEIEYQREAYREVIDEEFTAKKFDALLFNQQQKAGAEVYQTGSQLFPAYISDTMKMLAQC